MSADPRLQRRRVEVAVEEADLEHLLRALAHGEVWDVDDTTGAYRVPCVTGCQTEPTDRVLHGPRARLRSPHVWVCDWCGTTGTIWLARRLVLEDHRAIDEIVAARRLSQRSSA